VLDEVAEEQFPFRYLLSFFAIYQSTNDVSVPVSGETNKIDRL